MVRACCLPLRLLVLLVLAARRSVDAALSAQSRRGCACLRSLRHGLANLYRPGNQSAAVLAALGTGVMLILAVYLMQAACCAICARPPRPSCPMSFWST